MYEVLTTKPILVACIYKAYMPFDKSTDLLLSVYQASIDAFDLGPEFQTKSTDRLQAFASIRSQVTHQRIQ